MRTANVFLLICIVLATAFLLRLGVWQMQRLAWKEALIARVDANMKSDPLDVSQVEAMINEEADIEYRPATVSGRFLNDREAHFFATHKSRPGYFVYTPLQQTDGTIILVNRGYVPMDKKDQSTRSAGLIAEEVEINGLARSAPADKPNYFVPDNDLKKNVFYWKSLEEMKAVVGISADTTVNRFFIDADNTPNRDGLPEGGVTLIQFPNSHLQYALTWFGLAGALLLVGGVFLSSRIRQDRELRV